MGKIEQLNVKPRIEYYDILRGIGILLMVMGHIGFGDPFSKYIHGFHMPIFFFVAGYFYRPEKYRSYGAWILHSAKTLLIPYTVFVLMCQPLHWIYTGEWSFSYFILSYLTSNHNRIDVAGAYWFLLCMFTQKVIYYGLEHLLKEKWLAAAVIVLTLAGNLCRIDLPLCIDSALSMMAMMYLGMCFYRMREKAVFRKIFDIPWWVVLPVLCVNAVLILLCPGVNVRINDFGILPMFWLNAITAVLMLLAVCRKLDGIQAKTVRGAMKILKYFGRNSLVYLVLNELAIFTVQKALDWSGLGLERGETISPHDYLVKTVILILTLAALTVASEIFNRTKLKVLLGNFTIGDKKS